MKCWRNSIAFTCLIYQITLHIAYKTDVDIKIPMFRQTNRVFLSQSLLFAQHSVLFGSHYHFHIASDQQQTVSEITYLPTVHKAYVHYYISLNVMG